MGGRCEICGHERGVYGESGEGESWCARCIAALAEANAAEPNEDGEGRASSVSIRGEDDLARQAPEESDPGGSGEECFDEPLYNEAEQNEWLTDLQLLAAQSMAVNTNSRSDSDPYIELSPSVRAAIRTSNVFPIVTRFQAAVAAEPAGEPAASATAETVGDGASGRKRIVVCAAVAMLIATAAVVVPAAMSRPPRLSHVELDGVLSSAAMATARKLKHGVGGVSAVRDALPPPQGGRVVAPAPAGIPAGPMIGGSDSPVEKSNAVASVQALPGGEQESRPGALDSAAAPAAAEPLAMPAAPPQTLDEAIALAAGVRPAAGAGPMAAEKAPTAPAAAQGAEGTGFDRAAAQMSLRGIAGMLSRCKSDPEAGGTGIIRITFVPSGTATNAVVDGGTFAGTPAGSCIAQLYRSARVPSFSGGPVTVRQSFTIR